MPIGWRTGDDGADFFEHVLQLPLSYHSGAHSGRLVKVMVTGTNTLWSLWLAFFREHLVSIVSMVVLLPATLFINWRYSLILIVLCAVFAVLIALIISRTQGLQGQVERFSESGMQVAKPRVVYTSRRRGGRSKW